MDISADEVHSWSQEDVQDWLNQEGFGDFADVFVSAEIDGEALLNLKQQSLKDLGCSPEETVEDLYGAIRALQDEWRQSEGYRRHPGLPLKRSASSMTQNGRLPLSAKPKGPPPPRYSASAVEEQADKRSRITPSSKAPGNPPRSKVPANPPTSQPKAPISKVPGASSSSTSRGPGASGGLLRGKQPNERLSSAKAAQVRPESRQEAGADADEKAKGSKGWYNAPRNPAAAVIGGPRPPAAPPKGYVAGTAAAGKRASVDPKMTPAPKKPAGYNLRPELMRHSPAVIPRNVIGPPAPPSCPPPSKLLANHEEELEEELEEQEEQEWATPEQEAEEPEEEEAVEDFAMEEEEAEEEQEAEEAEEAEEPAPKAPAVVASTSKANGKDILVVDGLDLAQNAATNQGAEILLNSYEVFHVVLEVLRWLRASQPESTLQAFLPRTLYSSWEKFNAGSAHGDDIFRSCVTQVPSANISGALLQYIVRKTKEDANIQLVSNSSYDTGRSQSAAAADVCNNPIGYCFTPDGEFLCPDLPEPTLSSKPESQQVNGSRSHPPTRPAASAKNSMAPLTPPPNQRTIAKQVAAPVAKVGAGSRLPPAGTRSDPIGLRERPNPKWGNAKSR
mmetsp:Transcript_96759/g.153143  ORF Transcript_96759/g.153143 Transcript_96759/m.153143 type:complete len:618 (-) Transcript_96759:113-1966(-)